MPFVLSDPDALVAAAGGHPFVRSVLRFGTADARGWSAGGALVCLTGDERGPHEPPWVLAFGEPEPLARLVGEVARLLPDRCDVSVPRAAAHLLAGPLGLSSTTDWDFRWTTHRPPPVPGEDAVRVLAADEYAEAAALLDRANPTASARPEHPWVRQWVGVRDGGGGTGGRRGRLVAVAADTSHRGVGHLSSVATAPEARGRGLGVAVTAYLTRLHVAQFGTASLGFYPANEPARRIYDRLGYRDEVHMTSGPRRVGAVHRDTPDRGSR